MKQKTKDFLYKFGIVLACIGALGSIVAIGETIYQHSKPGGGSGGTIGGEIVTPNKPDIVIPTTAAEIAPTFFKGGIVDTTGDYEVSNAGLYNRYAFNAKNLTVYVEPNSSLKYQAFFYDAQDTYLSKSEIMTKSSNIKVPEGANARIEILPDAKVVTWDTAPIIANKLHVYVDKGQKVDIQGLSGIERISYQYGKDDNLIQVLNGNYKGLHYNFTVKNGLFTFNGEPGESPLGDYELVEAKLEHEVIGNVHFDSKPISEKDTVGYYGFKLDKNYSASENSNIITFRKGQEKDLTLGANGAVAITHFVLRQKTTKFNNCQTIPYLRQVTDLAA